ncbi:MAG TPA: TRAM domain-containing protein [Acidimicrobiales bacterium]|nr:TRAM domain-containing protein [Acidimicrobiales bacterium]
MGAIEVTTTAIAAGGDAVARDADGRVVFVTGALPGERVRAEVTEERKDFARARVVEVVDAAAERVAPPCPHVGRGCGGCTWQHVEPGAQRRLKADIVADALRRQGRIPDPEVSAGPSLGPDARRTTLRVGAAAGGRLGFRRLRSHEVVDVDDCLVAHPLLSDLLVRCDAGEADELTLRCGARTGERLVLAHPGAAGVDVPDGVVLVGEDELAGGRRAWITEEAAGRRWRVSARSFFQASPEGAEALVAAVAEAAGPVAPGDRVVDLYGGVGLFAGTVGAPARTTFVERSASAVADARVNLDGLDARVLRLDVDRWRPSPADLVIADPARSGLGRRGVAAVAGTGAPLVVVVSCDPAALGRDASLLAAEGYTLERCATVDLFPHTPHVEVVSAFRRPVDG